MYVVFLFLQEQTRARQPNNMNIGKEEVAEGTFEESMRGRCCCFLVCGWGGVGGHVEGTRSFLFFIFFWLFFNYSRTRRRALEQAAGSSASASTPRARP